MQCVYVIEQNAKFLGKSTTGQRNVTLPHTLSSSGKRGGKFKKLWAKGYKSVFLKGSGCDWRELTSHAELGWHGVFLCGVGLASFPRTSDSGVGAQGWILVLTFESVRMKVGISKFLGLE